MYIYIYIVTFYTFLFENVTKSKLNIEAFKILLCFSFLLIFYRLTMKPKVCKVYTTKTPKDVKLLIIFPKKLHFRSLIRFLIHVIK